MMEMHVDKCRHCGERIAPAEQEQRQLTDTDAMLGLSVGRNGSSSEIGESISQISLASHHVEPHHMSPIQEDEGGMEVGLDLLAVSESIGSYDSLASHSPTPSRHFWHLKNKWKQAKEYHKLPASSSYGSFGSTLSPLRHLRHFGEPSVRSKKRHRLNVILCFFLALTTLLLLIVGISIIYLRIIVPARKQKALDAAIKAHAAAAALRAEQCQGVTWQTACDRLTGAGARRRLYEQNRQQEEEDNVVPLEEQFLDSDDPTVTYDSNCLKAYRLQMYGNITFPYYSSQLLYGGGNYTMALFIQHGALRDAPDYFCSFKELMLRQHYRPFSEILIIAPDFSYQHDPLVHPNDAFWNSSKPWGDWRVGAESDPKCCGNSKSTVSSFDVLDHMLAMLTSKRLYPRMNKVSFVGHSAGGQMVQRYAVMSVLASLYGIGTDVNVEFIIANPSSYTYLDNRRYKYSCGECQCDSNDCRCNESCTEPPYNVLAVPKQWHNSSDWPCYKWNYDRWPYGLGSFSNKKGQTIPYALRDGFLGVDRALRIYRELHVVYMVGQNDTCNDLLPVCDQSCWKRENYEDDEWPCFRNEMDTRCQAMMQGPCRRTRGRQYLKYLRDLYGEPIHSLIEVPGVGHNASAMFGSSVGMRELFGSTNIIKRN